GLDFASGIRTLMRQDPDIIMVGEIRDLETAEMAIQAALTGHLVLSTIHTNSAAGAIPRLIDMGVEPFLLVSTIKLIVGQRLVRQLCEGKEEYELSKTAREKVASEEHFDAALAALHEEKLVKPGVKIDAVPFYHPKPSQACEEGYAGRIGIHEILKVSSATRDLIIKGATAEAVEEQARKEGMLTMLEDGIYKAARGVTSLEEVLRAVTE
ncbi:MAG: ATPase, T2SS/T4P/T4SS family, partial [Minisyncoccia bacterium]